MRIGVALVAWYTMSGPSPFHSQPIPHGMALWGADFSWLGDVELAKTLVPFWAVCLGLYAIGVVPVITLLPPIVAVVGHGVIGNSQGAIGHTTQIVGVTLIAAWLAAAWSAVAKIRRKPLPYGFNSRQLEMDWMRQVIISGYVVSALVKLYESGGAWLSTTPYFGLQIEKSTGMAYYSELVPPGNAHWLAQYFIDHPLIAKLAIGAGLPLELFAFLALYNRRSALIFGVGLYGLHTMISEVMNLGFVYHKALLMYLFVNPIWWAWWLGGKISGRNQLSTKSLPNHHAAGL